MGMQRSFWWEEIKVQLINKSVNYNNLTAYVGNMPTYYEIKGEINEIK